ncbi:TPA: ATP-dependent Clp protease ATP-binding subunit [Enterococcus faecium]|nr:MULTISPECIES: AAA family ATPase [Enterococcus]MCE2569413.1 AAA family ATPase [Enterococcus faecalis]MCF8614165.1 AAA family ATPase [Enterococcus faecium]MCF8629049.1 AAA family ATPase [Enterococcus faecium]MCF8637424.1 AAA family ATPase [Enterococcus faecium]MCF8640748.1 AAA family ATPase [Enterococcus faecium]
MENSTEFFKQIQTEFNHALTLMKPPKHKLVGREEELHELSLILNRPETPQVILLGEAGTGKTALASEWAERQRQEGKKVQVYKLSIGQLRVGGDDILQTRLETIIPRLKEYERVLKSEDKDNEFVLFIDEFHKVVSSFGSGNKIGGDSLKEPLANESLQLITATTRKEYENYIKRDDALGRRLQPLELNELKSNVVVEILRQWLNTSSVKDDPEASLELSSKIPDELLQEIVQANKLYREDLSEPAKSIAVMEDLIAKDRVDGDAYNRESLLQIFGKYNIQLDSDFDIAKLEEELKSIKGQPVAVYTVTMLFKRMKLGFDRFKGRKQPKATALFTGSTGVGKTAMAKAVARGLYGDENKVLLVNMPDYKTKDDAMRFRRLIGIHVRHDPSAIIVCDEYEKAGVETLDAFLSILDEGRISFTERGWDDREVTDTVSLSNTILFATTNAGAEMYDSMNRYSSLSRVANQENSNEYSTELKREYRKVALEIKQALIGEGLKPEVINRFGRIVPFWALSEQTLLEIAHNEILKSAELVRKHLNVDLRLPPQKKHFYGQEFYADDLSMYLVFDRASQEDSKSGGARNILHLVESEFEEAITEAIITYPNAKIFDVKLSNAGGFEGKGDTDAEIIAKPSVAESKENKFAFSIGGV